MSLARSILMGTVVILLCWVAVGGQGALTCSGGACNPLIIPGVGGNNLTLTAAAVSTILTAGTNLNLGAGGSSLWTMNGATGALSSTNNFDIIGVTGSSAPAAGSIGQIVTQTIATGASVTLATTSANTIASIVLSAGDWDVEGVVDYTFATTTSVTDVAQGSTSAANCVGAPALGAQDTFSQFETAAMVPTGTFDPNFVIPRTNYRLAVATTVCLVAKPTFTLSTLKAYGTLWARRMR